MGKAVSIIVPIYNGEKYIGRCIDSIIGQSIEDIEIILIDDGSSDNTKDIISKYAKLDNRIKVVYKENTGPSNSRNIGINMSRGEYIGFVDADDFIDKNMYLRLYNRAKKSDSDITICNYKEVFLEEDREFKIDHKLGNDIIFDKEEIEKNIISTFSNNENRGFYSLCNKIYKRDFILKNNLKIDESREHGEDWIFNMIAFTKAEKCSAISDCLYNYVHQNKESLMFKYRKEQFELILKGRREIKEIVPNKFLNEKELDKRFMYEVTSYIVGSFSNLKADKKEIILNVLKNKEVIDSAKNASLMPIHLKIIMKNIRKERGKLCYYLFLALWSIKYRGKSI
ncbi:glycosyltransferase [Clostridium chrysemydis]|uniref:glycosyltransferase n=1 Tax=Clostridium chrysemydis TaxID=2665504 RepID=UPI0018839279